MFFTALQKKVLIPQCILLIILNQRTCRSGGGGGGGVRVGGWERRIEAFVKIKKK